MCEAPVGCPALVGLLAGVRSVGFICPVTAPYLSKHTLLPNAVWPREAGQYLPGFQTAQWQRWPSCPPRFPVTFKCGLCRCREDMHGRLCLFRLCYPLRPVVQKSPSHSTQALAWLSSLGGWGGRLQWFRGATFSLGLTLRIKKSSNHSLAVATEQVRGVHYGGKSASPPEPCQRRCPPVAPAYPEVWPKAVSVSPCGGEIEEENVTCSSSHRPHRSPGGLWGWRLVGHCDCTWG